MNTGFVRRPGAERWGRLSLPVRVVVMIAGSLLAIDLLLAGVESVTGGSPSGPTSSSYATAPDGVSAWADLLTRRGHPVTRLRHVIDDRVPPGATLVVVDPRGLSPRELDAGERFVQGGGRLVVGGRSGLPLARRFVPDLRWRADAGDVARPLVPVPEVQGVRVVPTDGSGAWRDVGSSLPVLGAGDDVIAVAVSVGEGRVVALADTSPLHNRRLAEADAAALALGVVGERGRPVWFAEAAHGFVEDTGLFGEDALPGRWPTAVTLAAVAAALWLWSRGRRFGPPEEEARPLPPPRRAYVDALAASLARTPPGEEAVAPLRRRVRSRLASTGGAGLGEDERAALEAPVTDERSMLALGRVAARLEGEA